MSAGIQMMASSGSIMAAGSHIGDSTHHHDQSMCPVSFRPIKRTVRREQNDVPPDDAVEVLVLI
jgi:hypothetical protein